MVPGEPHSSRLPSQPCASQPTAHQVSAILPHSLSGTVLACLADLAGGLRSVLLTLSRRQDRRGLACGTALRPTLGWPANPQARR
jgi:hypothetical protein